MQQAALSENSPRSAGFVAAEDMARGAATMLGIAEALVAAGNRVDLTGFEAEVARLCAGILALPKTEGQALAPALVLLRDQAERLQNAMSPA
jgi:hypothetical protein